MKKGFSLLNYFLLLSALLVVGLSSIFFYKILYVQKQLLEEQLQNKSSSIEHSFIETVDYTSNILNYIARQISQHNKPQDLDYIYTLFKSFRVDPKIKDSLSWTIIGWVNDEYYATVDGILGILDKPIDLSIRDYIPHTFSSPWQLHLGEPVFGSTSNKWIIPAGIGATNYEGEYLGALVIGFEISKIKAQFFDILKDKLMDFALVNESGNIVFSSNKSLFTKSDIISSNKQAIKPYYINFSFFEDQNLFIKKIRKYPYFLYIKFNRKVVWEQFLITLKSSVFEYTVSFLFLSVVIYFFRKHIILPIKDLSMFAYDIIHGTKRGKVPKVTSNEMFSLAKAIIKVRFFKEHDRIVRRAKAIDNKNVSLKKINKELLEKNSFLEEKITTLNREKYSLDKNLKTIKLSDLERQNFVHELNSSLVTPFKAITNGIKIAQTETLGPLSITNYKNCFNAMSDALEQLTNFTTDFLSPEVVNIKELVDQCITIQNKEANEKNIEISTNIKLNKSCAQIYVDKLRLKQVIIATLSHAMEFVPEKGNILLTLKARKDTKTNQKLLDINISDDGLGFDEEKRAEFYKINGDISDDSLVYIRDVTRLSFSVIRQLIILHSGIYEIKAEFSKGTQFKIVLPYKKENDFYVQKYDMESGKETKNQLEKSSKVIEFPSKEKENV